MTLKIKIESLKLITAKAHISYIQDDLILEGVIDYVQGRGQFVNNINSKLGVKENTFQVIVDTLTICFSGDDLSLSSFDAYTNKELWKRGSIKLPENPSIGKCLIKNTGEEDDRVSLNYYPSFIYDEDNSLLKIQIIQTNSEEYWHIADNIIIGVSHEQISSVYIKNMTSR